MIPLDLDFSTAILTGDNSESLSIQYRREEEASEEINVAKLIARLQSPATTPAFDQTVETWTYNRPDKQPLSDLIAGDSTARLVLDSLNFQLDVYEHKWGVRYGFIAECWITTIQSVKFKPWPKRQKIGDYLLDGNQTAACTKFAFVCSLESLKMFGAELSKMANSNPRQSGG